MVINLVEIRKIFIDLLEEKISREDAAMMGYKLREAFDNNDLVFIPTDDESKIWDAIIFLDGIDLLDAPNSYLHNRKDIELFLTGID